MKLIFFVVVSVSLFSFCSPSQRRKIMELVVRRSNRPAPPVERFVSSFFENRMAILRSEYQKAAQGHDLPRAFEVDQKIKHMQGLQALYFASDKSNSQVA